MTFSLEQIEEDIIAFLDTTVFTNQETVEQAIPDIETVLRDSTGRVKPYVAYQLGDPQPWGSTSFMGPRGDDYMLPIYLRIVTPTPKIGRQLRSMGIDKFLGASFEWAGQIRKRVSGGVFPLTNSSGAVECYITTASFAIGVQLQTIP